MVKTAADVVRRWRSIGICGGVLLGASVGIAVAGPHFQEWSVTKSLLSILSATGFGGLIGFVSGAIISANVISGGYQAPDEGGGMDIAVTQEEAAMSTPTDEANSKKLVSAVRLKKGRIKLQRNYDCFEPW